MSVENINNKIDIIKNPEKIDNLLSKLEQKETSSINLEKIEFLMSDLDKEKTNDFLNILNINLSSDKWVQNKGWDFIKTLEKLNIA